MSARFPRASGKDFHMSEFKNVTIVKEANVYFNGNVTSRTVLFADGSKKTLGIMLPGDYEFGTADKEIMEILSGKLEILLPGTKTWKKIDGKGAFEVPAKSKFKLQIQTITDYCCSYIKE
jgi:purine/pyrimidine-nucleoside phosphorylase